MGKALLLNMKTYAIVKEFDSMAIADEAQDGEEFKGFPKHLVDRNDWDLSAVDMVKFYNVMVPEGAAVKRFSDRAAGMARLIRAMNGEVMPVTDETAIKEEVRKKRTGKLTNKVTIIEEKGMKTKGKKAKKTTAAKKTTTTEKVKRAPRGSNLAGESEITLTAAGKAHKGRAESVRGRLLAYAVKKIEEGVFTVAEFVRYGKSSVELDEGGARRELSILSNGGTPLLKVKEA